MDPILGPAPGGEERRRSNASVIGGSIGRRRAGPTRKAVLGSLSVHVGLVTAVLISEMVREPTPQFEVYRVKLYSPPAQVAAPEPAPVAINTPIRAPRVAEQVPERRTPPTPQPKPQVVETPPEEEPKPKEPEPVKGPEADPDSPGGQNIDVDIEGLRFPYPEYLENIILQLNRHFRWSGSPNLQNTVVFFINRDGTVENIRVLQGSGDFNFDLQVMSAIEQAGRRGAFGPLPEGFVQNRLPVKFTFLPPG